MIATAFHPFRLCQIGNSEGEPITREQALSLLQESWPEFPGFWREDELYCLSEGAETDLTLTKGRWLRAAK